MQNAQLQFTKVHPILLGIRHDIVFLQIFKNILNFYEAIKPFATLRSQKMISEI